MKLPNHRYVNLQDKNLYTCILQGFIIFFFSVFYSHFNNLNIAELMEWKSG